jgi:hypothetical protein
MDFDDPELLALVISADPATHATADDPPHHIVHGAIDDLVPVAQAQHLHDALTTAGASSSLTILPRVDHGIPAIHYLPVFDQFATLLIPTPIPADFNCDGLVNVEDLLLVIGAWGPCTKSNCPDTNDDGEVNVTDLLAVIANWTF